MAILRSREAWKKERDPTQSRKSSDLTPDEQANIKRALRFLAKRYGTWPRLAKAMGASRGTAIYSARKGTTVTAGIALRAARAAGEPLETILSGAWPRPETCPLCGRG